VDCRLVLGWNISHIADFYGCSFRTVQRILRLYNRSGSSVAASQRPGWRRSSCTKLDENDVDFIKNLVADHPEMYLDEIKLQLAQLRQKIVSVRTVWRTMKSLGFHRRKLEIQAYEASMSKQAEFILKVSAYETNQLVFVDETHSNRRSLERKYGWALRGQKPMKRGVYLRGKKYSSVAAMCSQGLLSYHTRRGAFNSVSFTEFIETFVVPEMFQFPGPKSVIVLDNANIHSVVALKRIAKTYHVKFLFLPPYSPKFNPIELVFSKVKKRLMRVGLGMDARGDSAYTILREAFESISPLDCLHDCRHCGYY